MSEKITSWINLNPVFHRILLAGIGSVFLYKVGYVIGKFIYYIVHP